MSILSFKLDFYTFALSLYIYHIFLFNHILFGVYCCPFPYKTLYIFVESYINIYIYTFALILKRKTNTDSFVVVDVVSFSILLPSYLLLFTIIECCSFSLHIFVCNVENICKYRKNFCIRLIRFNKQLKFICLLELLLQTIYNVFLFLFVVWFFFSSITLFVFFSFVLILFFVCFLFVQIFFFAKRKRKIIPRLSERERYKYFNISHGVGKRNNAFLYIVKFKKKQIFSLNIIYKLIFIRIKSETARIL